jgi:cell wall-associated NlpC family hydrolase
VPQRHRTKVTHNLPGLLVTLVALLLVVLAGAVGPAAATPRPPHHPGRSTGGSLAHRIHAVNARLDSMSRRGEQLDERYDQAVAAVAAARRTAARAELAAQGAAADYRAAHQRLIDAVTQQYEGGANPSIGALLSSSTPQAYLDSLSLADYMAQQFAAAVDADHVAHTRAGQAAAQADAAVAAARGKQAAVVAQRAALQRQRRATQRLLDSLTAQQRRARAHARAVAAAKARALLLAQQPTAASPRASHSPTPPPASVPVSGDVGRVIAFAEAQVGKAYAYGASGPGAYDCSGLTMASWAQAGVQLPHSAAGQYNYGTHVSYSQLQPGDLIFLYSPIGHVELYVGHDLAVSAADPSVGIVYVHPSQDMGDYVGATRLSG